MHQKGDGITIAKYGLLRGSQLLNKCWENTRGNLIKALKEAIFLPNKIAVCKCICRTVSTGNARAAAAAKAASAQQTKETMCTLLSENNLEICFSLQRACRIGRQGKMCPIK
jgi:hypothetical protein